MTFAIDTFVIDSLSLRDRSERALSRIFSERWVSLRGPS
jgi:hypothetical protein